MDLDLLLKKYSIKHEINPLTIDYQGIYRIKVNDSCMISIEKGLDRKRFFIYSTIGRFDQDKEKQLSLKTLEGNFFDQPLLQQSRANQIIGGKYD